MKLSEELAYVSVMIKEGLAGPPARSAMFPGIGSLGANTASQVSQQAKNRVEQNRNNAKQQAAPQGAAAPVKPGMVGGKADIPIPPTPTLPKITPQLKRAAAGVELSPERLRDLRSEFEESMEKEKLLRRHGKWWEDLARSRSVAEDTSPGGYAGSALERLLPIPQTGTEAMIRTPLVGLGAYGGYHFGKDIEPTPSEELVRVLRPAKERGREALTPIARNIGEAVSKGGGKVVKEINKMDPELLSKVLRSEEVSLPFGGLHKKYWPKTVQVLPSPESKVLSARKSIGGKRLDIVRREIKNIIAQTSEESLLPAFKPYRWGGALAGLAGASVLTGLPLAIRSILRKREGGEAAVRARDEAKNLTGQAEQMQALRERLLKRLPE